MRYISITAVVLMVCSIAWYLQSRSQPAMMADPAAASVEEACEPPSTFLPGTGQTANPAAWLPDTPAPTMAKPAPHDPDPTKNGDDCPFYKAAWQRFLIVTKPTSNGAPEFLSYAAIADLFPGGSGSPAGSGQCDGSGVMLPRLTGGVFQAKSHKILVDRFGHPVFYDIRVDKGFQDFIKRNNLSGIAAASDIPDDAPQNGNFDAANGVIEIKSAWQIVDGPTPPNYFSVRACVPVLSIVNGAVDAVPTKWRAATVTLLAVHVVFSLAGHNELIWATFEHVDSRGVPDIAGAAPGNPSTLVGTDPEVCAVNYPLCAAGTTASKGNHRWPGAVYAENFDSVHQVFDAKGQIFSTPIFRVYTHSQTDGKQPCLPVETSDCTSGEDDQVREMNTAMPRRFADISALAADNRQHFRLAGAIWLNRPEKLKKDEQLDIAESASTDDDNELIAGEGRLSSTAMESFTQAKDQFSNCLSCHDSQIITSDVGPAGARPQIGPKLANVSHILSKYLFDKELQADRKTKGE